MFKRERENKRLGLQEIVHKGRESQRVYKRAVRTNREFSEFHQKLATLFGRYTFLQIL
jgi:hypothetical protein